MIKWQNGFLGVSKAAALGWARGPGKRSERRSRLKAICPNAMRSFQDEPHHFIILNLKWYNPEKSERFWILTSLLIVANLSSLAAGETLEDLLRREVEAHYASLEELYRHFHSNPELSAQEINMAERLAAALREAGYESRERTIQAIRRIVAGIAATAALPEELEPEVQLKDEYTPSLYNDPQLVERLAHTMEKVLGKETVSPVDPVMAGEDSGRFGRTEERLPIALFCLGNVNPTLWEESRRSGQPLPSLHSPRFAPSPATTIRTGVLSMVSAVLESAAPDKPLQ